mmetsp:Transcript_17647/g.36766  ORF Transcript_17647/g.36766 Transcript_17647/m.36766 type:complete len:436 (-) Transcript_17647:334-1641(-)
MVSDVTGRKYSRHRSASRPVRSDDVVARIHVRLSLDKLCVRVMAYRNKGSLHVKPAEFCSGILRVAKIQMRERFLLLAIHLGALAVKTGHLRIPSDLDVRVGKDPLLKHQAGTERAAPVDQLHPRADARQHERFLHGRVSSPDHRAGAALEEVAVAGGAAGDTVPAIVPLPLGIEPAAICTGRKDDRMRLQHAALVGHDLEWPHAGVHGEHGVIPNLGEETAGLVLHDLDHLPAILAGHARVVLHVHALCHQLPAQGRGNDQGAEVRPSGVDSGSHARGAPTDDDDLFDRTQGPVAVEAARVVRQPPLLLLQLLHGGVLLAPLELLSQLLDRCSLQIGAALGAGLGRLLLFRLVGSLALLRCGSLAILLLEDPHHRAEVLAVLLNDPVDALCSGLGRVMLLVELFEGVSRDLDVITLKLLHQTACPLSQRVLIST